MPHQQNRFAIKPTGSPTNHTPLYLLFAWFLLNLLQAAFTPLDADESYYWMYANQLDWGYFDHPPAVAVLVALGVDWLPGELGLRFGHVLTSTATIAGIWYLLEQPRGALLWLGAALVFAQPFLNVYGFVATPDGPLLLFTVLYLLAFRRFLGVPTLASGALWGLTMAGLLYSKYHGVVLIFFSVLPHLFWLLRQPGAWVAALGGAALYAPHLYWQYANDYSSFRYHVRGRNDAYQFKYTTEYLLNQLVIFSPLLVWIFGKMLYHYRSLFLGRRRRMQGEVTQAVWADAAFLRVNYWIIGGFLLFFLYTTTRGGTEAQWTALLSMPLCYLTFRMVRDDRPPLASIIKKLGFATVGILLLARLLLMVPREWLPFEKPFDHELWVEELQEQANGLPVMVQNSYRYSSLYEFYSGQPAWTFTDVLYRQNQYDLWSADTTYHNQEVFLLAQSTWNFEKATPFPIGKKNMLTEKIDSFQVMKGLTLAPVSALPDTLSLSQAIQLTLIANTPLGVNLNTGNLPIKPMIAIHYADKSMRFWTLRNGRIYDALPARTPAVVFEGPLKLFSSTPLGYAKIEFGMAYQGMPMIRGQSSLYPVVIVE